MSPLIGNQDSPLLQDIVERYVPTLKYVHRVEYIHTYMNMHALCGMHGFQTRVCGEINRLTSCKQNGFLAFDLEGSMASFVLLGQKSV